MREYTATRFTDRDRLNKTLYLIQFFITVLIPAIFVGIAAVKIQQNGLFQLDPGWTDFAYLGLLAGIAFYVLRMFYHFPYTFPQARVPAIREVLAILFHLALILYFTKAEPLEDALGIFGMIIIQANVFYSLYLIVGLGLPRLFRYVFIRKKDRSLTAFIAAYILFALISLPVFLTGIFIAFMIAAGAVVSLRYSIPLYIGNSSGLLSLLLILQYFMALISVYLQTGRVNATFVSDQIAS